ncbi:MAG: hypothetical protein A2Y33_00995 [Spirochaetes bacterium GWF1_51_8]|nr:MAG: hypothetical protein A2Y33_00995 [Spirochaetes bacterium GWF1_51_8]
MSAFAKQNAGEQDDGVGGQGKKVTKNPARNAGQATRRADKAQGKSRKIRKRHNSFLRSSDPPSMAPVGPSPFRGSRRTNAFSSDFPGVLSALKCAGETANFNLPCSYIFGCSNPAAMP